MRRKCKKCDFKTRNLIDMRIHWQDDHPNDFNKISKWLRDDDEAIAALEQVAKEGMLGHGH